MTPNNFICYTIGTMHDDEGDSFSSAPLRADKSLFFSGIFGKVFLLFLPSFRRETLRSETDVRLLQARTQTAAEIFLLQTSNVT
jgi:hypothetical protein